MEPAPEIRYKRLTRSGGRSEFAVAVRSRTSLWLGPDHLLCVESNGYSETYKRFYFRDIQAMLIQKTKRYLWWNIIVGSIALICCIIVLLMVASTDQWRSGDMAGAIVLGSIAALWVLVLLINVFLGPTCKTFLRTAVQIEQLPSLSRIRKTRRVLDKIRPLIVAAQGGELSHEAALAAIRESAAPIAAPAPASTTANAGDNPAPGGL